MGFTCASKQSVDATFEALDMDQSGQMTCAELTQKLRLLGERPEHIVHLNE